MVLEREMAAALREMQDLVADGRRVIDKQVPLCRRPPATDLCLTGSTPLRLRFLAIGRFWRPTGKPWRAIWRDWRTSR